MPVTKQAQFQANLLGAAGQAIIATDVEGRIIYWNHAAEQQCGWSSEEALGENLLELMSSPEMRGVAEQTYAELAAGAPGRGISRYAVVTARRFLPS